MAGGIGRIAATHLGNHELGDRPGVRERCIEDHCPVFGRGQKVNLNSGIGEAIGTMLTAGVRYTPTRRSRVAWSVPMQKHPMPSSLRAFAITCSQTQLRRSALANPGCESIRTFAVTLVLDRTPSQ